MWEVGEVYGGELEEVGVDSPQTSLERGATSKGRKELAEVTGISEHLILKWVNHIDLSRITGVGSQYPELLEACGVDTAHNHVRVDHDLQYCGLLIVRLSQGVNCLADVFSNLFFRDRWQLAANSIQYFKTSFALGN